MGDFADYRFVDWHNSVHDSIGGVMATMDSPAAVIFWPWHAYVDNLYTQWRQEHF